MSNKFITGNANHPSHIWRDYGWVILPRNPMKNLNLNMKYSLAESKVETEAKSKGAVYRRINSKWR